MRKRQSTSRNLVLRTVSIQKYGVESRQFMTANQNSLKEPMACQSLPLHPFALYMLKKTQAFYHRSFTKGFVMYFSPMRSIGKSQITTTVGITHIFLTFQMR